VKKINFPLLNNSIAYLCGLCVLASLAGTVMATSIKDISEYPMGDRSIKSARATNERIAPVGKVCLEGEECKHEVSAQTKVDTTPHAEAAPKAPRDGQQIVQTSCFGCHGTGAAGAPLIGKPIWKELSAAKGVDALIKSALIGKGAMPPKGMCMDCTDDEIKAAVEYMIAQ